MPALEAQVLDVGTGGLGDPQPVEREQGDQRMLDGRAEPGGDQQRGRSSALGGIEELPLLRPSRRRRSAR